MTEHEAAALSAAIAERDALTMERDALRAILSAVSAYVSPENLRRIVNEAAAMAARESAPLPDNVIAWRPRAAGK